MTDDEIKTLSNGGFYDGGHTDPLILFARAVIKAYQDKLLAGVKMPTRFPAGYIADTEYFMQFDEAVQYAAAAAAQAREKALGEAKGVCVERMSFWRLSDDRYYEAESCAYAIEKLKGKQA